MLPWLVSIWRRLETIINILWENVYGYLCMPKEQMYSAPYLDYDDKW